MTPNLPPSGPRHVPQLPGGQPFVDPVEALLKKFKEMSEELGGIHSALNSLNHSLHNLQGTAARLAAQFLMMAGVPHALSYPMRAMLGHSGPAVGAGKYPAGMLP